MCCTCVIFTVHTDVFHGTAERLHLRKSCHGTASVPRPTYLVVLVTAKNLGTGVEPVPFTLSEFAVPIKSGTRPKILAVPCPVIV